MRIRRLLAVLGATTLLVGLAAAPASAGTGVSTYCSDGVGYREIPILTSPITVGVEVAYPPGGDHQYLLICYSTTAEGQPGVITGGAVAVDVWTNTGTVQPGGYVGIGCHPDYVTGIGPACAFANSANVAPGDLGVSVPPSATCLVSVGSGCVAYVPGVKVVTGADPARPLLAVQVLSVPVRADAPVQCIAVVVTCP